MGLVVQLDERRDVRWNINPETGNAERSRPRDSEREIEMCARCHARRSPISRGYVHGEPLLEHYLPRRLDEGMYHADGQIDDEVYVYGSFLQSRMYHAGVTCSDCHEPHSLELRAPGNGVCLLEFENETPVPVAVALIVQLPAPGYVEVYDDTLSVDGVPILRAGRSIARCLITADADALAAGLEGGEALPPAELTLPAEGRQVALVFPVPHTAVLRTVVTAGGGNHLGDY